MQILTLGSAFLYHLLRPACEQLGHRLAFLEEGTETGDTVRAAVEEAQPRLLLAFADWQRNVPWAEVLEIARRKDVRTAFWNIEDPNHFDAFKDRAEGFDHVFTTAAERVEDYRALGHDDVSVLRLACAPSCHYREYLPRDLDAIFVGNHYPGEPDRMGGEQNVLLPFLSRRWRLEIWGYDWWRRTPYESLWKGPTQGPLREYLARARIVLGMNEQRSSPTMTSMRPYETLACGAFQLNDWSVAMESLFEDGRHLALTRSPGETAGLMDRYLHEEARRETIAREGQRYVYAHPTYAHRIQQMLTHIWPEEARRWFIDELRVEAHRGEEGKGWPPEGEGPTEVTVEAPDGKQSQMAAGQVLRVLGQRGFSVTGVRRVKAARRNRGQHILSVRPAGSLPVPGAHSSEPPVAVTILHQDPETEAHLSRQTYPRIPRWLCLRSRGEEEESVAVPEALLVGCPLDSTPAPLHTALNRLLVEMASHAELLVFCLPTFLEDREAVLRLVQRFREHPWAGALYQWHTSPAVTAAQQALDAGTFVLAVWRQVVWSIGGFRHVPHGGPFADFVRRVRAVGYEPIVGQEPHAPDAMACAGGALSDLTDLWAPWQD